MEQFSGIHMFFAAALGALELAYTAFVAWSLKDLHRYIWRIRVLLPAYYLMIALLFFTGLLMAAAVSFEVSIARRLLALLGIFALAIFEFILFKKARKKRSLDRFKPRAIFIQLGKLGLFALGAL